MRVTSTKKYFTGIILFVTHIFFLSHPGFSAETPEEEAGPVIAGVVINSCIGSITISVTSGTAPYSYAWEDSGGNPVGTNSFIVTGLGPDNYTVTVTDDNGDTVVATYTVTNPPDLVGSVVVNNVTCRGDSDAQVVVTMSNGNPDYNWELFDSGSNSVQTGTAAFPSNVITIGGLGVDSYTLEVEDDDGCTGTITFNIIEPAQFLGANLISQTNATCSNSTDGSLEVVGTGGWGGYTYAWYNASSAFLGNTSTITGLTPGDYTVVITDANGCQISPTYTITGPAPITNASSLTHATCNGDTDGAIDITPGGGNGTFSYLWSNGATSQDLSGIGAGNYSVTITDIQGCTYNENFTITEPTVLAINETIGDVSCNGGSDGTITSNVSGGTTAYTYSWSTGATSANLTGLSAGSYTLTVTDANSCQTIESFTVSQPVQPLSVTGFTESLPTCFGGADGTLQVNVTGGTTAYTYLWSTGATTAMITGLSSGAYAVTITDANGCVTVGNYTLNDPVAIAVSTSVTIPTCNGGADGSITASASNGLGPYVYNWNTGDTGPTVNGLSAGSYNVTVTDANGCSVVQNVIMGEPSPILSNAAVNDISCNGLTDGNISLAVTGGTGPYTYNWSTGSTASSISGLTAGAYTVTITDANACTEVDNFTIIEPAPIGTSLSSVDVLCRGNSTGSIDLTPSGGTTPYTYAWSNGATTQDLSSLVAGSYTVTVTDASLCSTVANVTITEPATSLTVSGTETHVTCNGGTNGAIDLTASGGVGAYTFLWNTGATTEDITALASGNYSVQVTDANGCVNNTAFTITEPTPLLVSPSVDDITCNGDNDGAITLSVSGGTGPYTYSWADGPTSQNRSSLSPGNYTVTTTDANGCQDVKMITISEPAVLTTSTTQQNVNCFGASTGIINLTVNGGTAPYSYAWSDGSTSEDLSAIPAGTYTVTVTDANGCTSGETVTITEPAAALTYTSSVSQISCNGAADGSIDLTVSGGTGPYTYNWSNGSSSEDLSGLPAAVYNVVITDALGCTTNESFTITDPPVLSFSGIESDVSCFGDGDGAIDLTVTGGEAPYTYIWAHGPVTEDVSGLGPGSYSVQVLDNRGCSALTSFTIAEPSVLALSSTKADVSCFGGNDGAIDLTVAGGTGPYTYSWSNGSSSEDLSTLISGTYTVTVTDFNGCSDTETVTIDQPVAALSKTETVTDVTCNGLANGTIDLTISGGTAPYTFAWSDGFITEDRNALGPGTYNVTITDANGCQLVDSYAITQPDVLALSEVVDQVSCFGADDGEIDLTVMGGTAPYTYTWADGPVTEDRTGLSPGSYTVVVTDANGCQENTSVIITESAVLTISESITDVDCFGNATGAIDATIMGGTAPYAYNWSGGETTEDLSNLTAGTYTLTVTDLNGCIASETFTVAEPTAALSLTETLTDVTCNGLGNGTIDITVAGGTAPYSYSWSDGGTLEDKSALTPGNYNVTVTDVNGCQIFGAYTITEPVVLASSLTSTDISCFGADDGEIDISVSGGTAPYTYLWADGATTQDRSSLSPGLYSLVITDANGCQTNEAVTIIEPAVLGITQSVTDVDCFGNSTGAIDITISGGTTPYVYAWSNGSSTEDLGSLIAGTYTVTVTDANNCQLTQPIVVAEPALPLTINEVVTDISCFGANDGSVQLNMTGGTAPYTFAWDNGASTENIAGLLVGNYNVTVTDANGCTTSGAFTIDSPAALQLSSSIQNLSCNSAGDGAIDLTLTGGTGPYSFNWSNGATTEDLTGVAAGNYSVTATDANGCSLVRNFTVTEPLTLIANGAVTKVTCFAQGDGAIDVGVSGGVTPYSYLWSNGAVTEDLFNIDGGNYSLTITDANGCQTIENFVVTEPAAALSITGIVSDVSCFGANDGTITTTISGGTAPYVYSWNQGAITKDIAAQGPGGYQLTVTDANGCSFSESFVITGPDVLQAATSVANLSCNGAGDGEVDLTVIGGTAPYSYTWSNGETTEDLTGLSAGTYQVLIIDANGCSMNEVVSVQEPAVLSLTNTSVNVSCYAGADASIDLTVSGGTFPFTYSWSNGATTEDISGLIAGSYTVTVTDNNGCTDLQTVTITEPTELILTGTSTDVTCNGLDNGTIDLTISGGTTPYAYAWSDGSTDQDRISLIPGSYNVTVTDANGCQVVAAYTIDEPDALSLTYTSADISCFGAADGDIDVSMTGGTAPYTYLWSDGLTTEDRSNLGPGSYILTVTDAQNCQTSQTVVIDEPAVLSLSHVQTNVDCFGNASGNIDLSVAGGTVPYSYAWSNGATAQDVSGLIAGSYTVTVTDNNGCTVLQTVTITEPTDLILAGAKTDITCNGLDNGTIDLTISGGTTPYAYAWSDGSTDQDRISLIPGSYNVTVTDANGCQVVAGYTIDEPDALSLTYTSADISCFGAADGDIDVSITGGTAPYTYLWSDGLTTEDRSNLGPGSYTLTVTDAQNCQVSQAMVIDEPAVLALSHIQTNVDCFGNASGNIDLSVAGGTVPYSYAWSNGATSQDVSGLTAGSYTVTVTDNNGCTALQTVTITEPTELILTGTSTDITCNGLDNGMIDLTISGGTTPYAYAWSDGSTDEDRISLIPGSYNVTVTDANGCQVVAGYTIDEPDALGLTYASADISCFGAADGDIDMSMTGGTAPYIYLWSDGLTTEDRSNLGPGSYTLTVTDAQSCQISQTVVIDEPAVLSLSHTQTNVDCFGNASGNIDLSVAGGTVPYSYAWSNGATSQDVSGLTAGSYSVTVTDNNGCTALQTVTITEPTELLLTGTSTDITCNGVDNGTIDLTISGGTTPYAYAWSDGSTDEDRISLIPGSYNVTVTDANGCQVVAGYTIDEPDALGLTYASADISCFGAADGDIDMSITGGTAPYIYLWSDGPTTEDRSNLGPGSYTLTVTDAQSCQISQTVVIDEPAILALSYADTDVNCFGEATGAIDLTVSGGTMPYAYTWSEGSVVEDLSGLTAGTYNVTVTDANGCVATEVVAITEPAAALAFDSELVTEVTCSGFNDGAIDLTIAGGTAPYSFSWNDGNTSEDRSSLLAGNYEVTVTDANGCQISNAYTITEPTILTTSFTLLNVSCFGVGDGSIDLTVSGGTSPYFYTWSDGPTTEDRTGLSPGTYTVQVTDANGCQSSESITITQPDALAIGQSVMDINCYGDNTGSIDLTITGGTAPYAYSWSNGATTEDLNTLLAGSYGVTVTDAQGCAISQTIMVSEPAAALSATASLSHETCATFGDGSIDLTVTGGTAPYSYAWNTGATTEDISALLPGTYQVTVSDNNGCEIIRNYTITGPQPLSLAGTVTQISCRNAADGAIDLAIAGGTAPYSYTWSNGETTQDLTDLDIGSVSVLVTDANGCTIVESFTITQPLELVANSLVANVSCFGADNGSIDLSITGGTAPYTYTWSNGATTEDINNLSGGAYTVGVLDANGCQVTAVIIVEAPSAPLAATTSITDVTCNGLPSGRIDLTVTGGTAPYSYAWSNGSSQQNLINAFAGDYEVTVTDIKGCVFIQSYTIAEPEALSASFDITPTSCFGDADGSILVSPEGGTGPFSYVWSNGSTSKDQLNLSGGTYNVTITDANNCSVVLSALVGDSRDLTVDVARVDILCKGESSGAISLNVTGGSGAYTYLWSNGESSRDLSGIDAGVYQVVISDAGGCATTASVVISEPSAVLGIAVDRSPDMTCFGETSGFARVVPRGGVAPYSYLWSNGARTAEINEIPAGDYTVSVSDANGCTVQESFRINQPDAPIGIVANGNLDLACMGNADGNIQLAVSGGTGPYTYLWSTGSNQDAISDLVAGDYTIRVVDALGCVKEQTFTVRQPDELRIADAFVNESQCFDDRNGSIQLEITGGTQPYHYQWSNEATTKNIIGITSGEYNVVVTDARGCSVQASYQLDDPGLFKLSPEVSEISCVGANDASISLNIEGGVGDLAIRWNTGHVGETLTELEPGIYNVTVSDENGCSLQQTFNIIEPLPVTLDAFVQDAIKCGDPQSGQINLIVSGGRAPYSYRWSNGDTSQSLTDLFPGTYAVTVTDRFGCTTNGTYSVQQPDPLKIGLRTEILVNCDTRTVDNRVVAEVSGGFGGYRYEWSRGSGNGSENIVSEPGRLTLFVTDDRGCQLEKSVDISIPELGEADFDFTSASIVRDGVPAANDPVSFFDGSFGDIIDWAWNFGDGFDSREVDPIHTYSAPGTYTVTLTITDGSGCTSLKTETIEITEGYRIMIPDAFTPNGDGNNDFFRPRLLGLEKVQLMVFNTWGEVIFSTEDVGTPGWDGTIRGKPAENGNYVYKLVGLSFNGLKVERDGVFALIN